MSLDNMADWLTNHEAAVRFAIFMSVLAVMASWEAIAPARRIAIPRLLRWSNNFALVVVNSLLVRLIFPASLAGFALFVEQRNWGLLGYVPAPAWVKMLLALLVLDLAIYLQHVMFHAVPLLWRLHRMHHADVAFDVSTGIRFHPIEILISMAIKFAVVAAFGVSATVVIVFEILLNSTAMFNHSNIRLPGGLDRILRWLVVTPDMHRVHHSVYPEETNSNYGFNLPWWDRLLGTYRSAPRDGHAAMRIGLEEFRSERELWIDRMIMQPFRGHARACPVKRDSARD